MPNRENKLFLFFVKHDYVCKYSSSLFNDFLKRERKRQENRLMCENFFTTGRGKLTDV